MLHHQVIVDFVGLRKLFRWALTFCALACLTVNPIGGLDQVALSTGGFPVVPTEEDDTAPTAEYADITQNDRSRRGLHHLRRFDAGHTTPHLHAHTPQPGFMAASFRSPPDHFRNGLGTPLRC